MKTIPLPRTRLTVSQSKEKQAASRPLRTLADEMTSQAIDEAIALGAAAQNPAWSSIGL